MMRIDESKLPEPPVGAHLVSPRTGFSHHGLYIGGGKVIHYSGMAKTLRLKDIPELPNLIRYGCIVKTSLRMFCDGHGFRVQEHPRAKFSGEAAVARAKTRLYERSYYLYSNNCEHFVNWCIDDSFRSPVILRLLLVYAIIGFVVHRLLLSRHVSLGLSGKGRLALGGFFAVIGAVAIGHFIEDSLQPSQGLSGLERKNRRYGRIGVRVGIVLAILFSLFGIRRGWKKFASFTPYFLPLWGGLGTYFVCQALDHGKKKGNPVQCVKSTGAQAPGSASQV